jgi:hypothetical protein
MDESGIAKRLVPVPLLLQFPGVLRVKPGGGFWWHGDDHHPRGSRRANLG